MDFQPFSHSMDGRSMRILSPISQNRTKSNCKRTHIYGRKPPNVSLQSEISFKAFSTDFKKWSNTLKQFVGNLPMNCLSVFDHFVGLALKGLNGLPLTSISDDISDFEVPNRNHLLVGEKSPNQCPGNFREHELNFKRKW